MRKTSLWVLAVLSVAGAAAAQEQALETLERPSFPSTISLPNGFRPEGIVTGRGPVIYAGSLANGAIYAASLLNGQGRVLVPGQQGRVAVGLGFDVRTNFIYASGGPTGMAHVHDARTGRTVGTFRLTAESPTFINDVIVTRQAAYFTDSMRPVFYKLPLGPHGQLPDPDDVEEIELGGDFTFVPGVFNANGIVATPSGKTLIIVHSNLGVLYRVDARTGDATLIDLGGEGVANGDGLLLAGRTLLVVQNQLNQVAVVRLDRDLDSGEIVRELTDPRFDIPTTIARFGPFLYVVNARFTTPPTPQTPYAIVRLRH
jgi:sugar lactone lactonase YvrE